ncbi:MAG: hypothetical protein Q8N51_15065 [Gammaproteobacteria bacterium]|nr:hypothetical protein [Gammaproteobacteria bacterium]
MRAHSAVLATFLLVSLSPAIAVADELAQLRDELARTKALLSELEVRLAAVEAKRAVEPVQPAPAAMAGGGSRSSDNAFNPAISVILNGSYNAYSRDPDDAIVSGFTLGDEAGLPNEGFSLGESELNLSANIDTMFYGSITASLEDDAGDTEVGVEEAYIETLSLPYGAKIRAGRMFPVLGYLNEMHSHVDAFVDRPLPYRAFLGGNNFRDDGIQASVILPTDLFAEMGGGIYRGTGFPAAGSASNGRGTQTLFTRFGGDIGVSHSWLAGVSFLRAEADALETPDLTFNGTSDIYVADAKYTWAPAGNLASRYVALQGEYFWRNQDGSYNDAGYEEDTSGWYAQAVYKFLPRWKAGYRFARLDPAVVPLGLEGTALDSGGHDPFAHSLVLEFDNSEFSNIRLQYTRDDSGPRSNDAAVLRYTISMGAHGGHKY